MPRTPISTAGQEAVAYVLRQLREGIIVVPDRISVQRIADQIGVTPQVVGMAFDRHIEPALRAQGIAAKKVGKPVHIHVRKIVA